MGDGNESEAETLQERLRSNLTQLYAEYAILERIVYKNKNQHRRSSYFQYLLKVRRDLKLFRTARLEDLSNSCFQVIIGNKPEQRIYHLESLKKGAHDGGKPNFMESLLGAARLLADMVEPMLKAACEISILLARSFFMAFSLTVLALLARLRVLVQQILLDLVSAFNMVSSISQEKQSAKLTRKGIEVVREYYPLTRGYLTLECIWVTDKYTLLEKTCRIEDNQLKESDVDAPSVASEVQYHSIECLLEAEPVPAVELQKAQKTVGSFLFQSERQSGLLKGISMTDSPGILENAMAGDNVEGSQQDENARLCSHWHHICVTGIASVIAGCTAWLQLAVAAAVLNSNDVRATSESDDSLSQHSVGSRRTKMKRQATADVILQSVSKNIASSVDNVSRAIIESTANKMSRPYDHSEELFTSLKALDLSHEYLIECYAFLTKHEAEANKFLGVPQQFRKKILTRIMSSVSLSK